VLPNLTLQFDTLLDYFDKNQNQKINRQVAQDIVDYINSGLCGKDRKTSFTINKRQSTPSFFNVIKRLKTKFENMGYAVESKKFGDFEADVYIPQL
jgi:hypothetical protein